MTNNFGVFVMSVVAGFAVGAVISTNVERDMNSAVYGVSRETVTEAIEKCEVNLPRNLNCKVIVMIDNGESRTVVVEK